MKYIIYQIENMINGKTYIGAHKTDVLEDGYYGSGTVLKRAIAKYGKCSFNKTIIAVFDNSEDMYRMESVLVNEDYVSRMDTYNIKLGGAGGFDYINTQTGWSAVEYINKNGMNNNSGQCYIVGDRIKSDPVYKKEFGRLISDGLKKYCAVNGQRTTFLGKVHTDDTKKKMSLAKKGKKTGSENHRFGRCWVFNVSLKQSKTVGREELPTYLSNGWVKGRKIKFDNR